MRYSVSNSIEFDPKDFKVIRNLLNFAIKSKDECLDPFVLFDLTSSNFFLELAKEYTRVSMEDESKECQQMRVFNLTISNEDAVFCEQTF